jgi:ubiquinone/menaquinone biosynthesis C-methylase UbiE
MTMPVQDLVKAEKFWDRISRNYEKRPIKNTQAYNQTLAATKKYLDGQELVLECGCGTGSIALEFAGHVKDISAFDISSKMIAIATRKAAERQIENIEFVQGTLFDERFENESYHLVLAFNVLHLLDEPQKVVHRIGDLLKPGGLFISGTVCLREKQTIWNLVALILKKTGIIPPVNSFEIAELKSVITAENFELIETDIFFPDPPRLFMVAKKCAA